MLAMALDAGAPTDLMRRADAFLDKWQPRIEAAVRADATRATEAEVAALRALAFGWVAYMHGYASTNTDPSVPYQHRGDWLDCPWHPCRQAADIEGAALAAQPAGRAAYLPAPLDIVDDRPAAPEAEPVVILHGDEHDDPGGYCATCEALAKSAPEAEPVCVLCGDTEDNALHRSRTHPGAHPFTKAPRTPEAEPERCAFDGCGRPPEHSYHSPCEGGHDQHSTTICHTFRSPGWCRCIVHPVGVHHRAPR